MLHVTETTTVSKAPTEGNIKTRADEFCRSLRNKTNEINVNNGYIEDVCERYKNSN